MTEPGASPPVEPVASSPGAPCPNCGAPASTGAFCPTCGQRNDRLRLTARALLSDLLEAVLKVDRKVPSTARSLFVPGALTIDYLQGRRARHLRPLSLFLFCAGLHYLAWSAVKTPEESLEFRSGFFAGKIQISNPEADGGLAEGSLADGGTEAADGGARGGRLPSRLVRALAAHPERPAQALDSLQSPKGQLALVLAYLLGVAVATRARRRLLSEHLVFVLHIQAFSAVVGAAGLLLHLPQAPMLALSLGYDAAAFFRVYRFGWWGSAWRFAVAMGLGVVTLSVVVSGAVLGYLLW